MFLAWHAGAHSGLVFAVGCSYLEFLLVWVSVTILYVCVQALIIWNATNMSHQTTCCFVCPCYGVWFLDFMVVYFALFDGRWFFRILGVRCL